MKKYLVLAVVFLFAGCAMMRPTADIERTMADQKLTELGHLGGTEHTAPAESDITYGVDDPGGGSPSSVKVSFLGIHNMLESALTGFEIHRDNLNTGLYEHTECIYIEDPTADDDLTSIYRNSTAKDFTLTEIWAESDQTVNFDLQVDDGSPADVNGTDISPAAGEAEDTSLSGDTTLAAGEELDLVVTSVSGTPTWVSICWTYTVND